MYNVNLINSCKQLEGSRPVLRKMPACARDFVRPSDHRSIARRESENDFFREETGTHGNRQVLPEVTGAEAQPLDDEQLREGAVRKHKITGENRRSQFLTSGRDRRAHENLPELTV